MLDLYVKTRIRFSLRDTWLFEITEVEITRVDCMFVFRWQNVLVLVFLIIYCSQICQIRETKCVHAYKNSDSARPKCSPDILSGQHSPCSDILKYFRTNDESTISFKVYL